MCEYRRRRNMNTVNDGSTEKMTVNQKLELLRTKMKERGMDAYMVPTADFHESEYVGDHFKCRQFLTGFTGSAGIAVVTMKEACLWVDGRYFVQAAVQLQGTSVNGTGRRAFCSRISGSRSAGKWLSGL